LFPFIGAEMVSVASCFNELFMYDFVVLKDGPSI
jgi:hypothetical protein